MFDQLPNYVHWSLTQMRRTNIDADLLWRGILSLSSRDKMNCRTFSEHF